MSVGESAIFWTRWKVIALGFATVLIWFVADGLISDELNDRFNPHPINRTDNPGT